MNCVSDGGNVIGNVYGNAPVVLAISAGTAKKMLLTSCAIADTCPLNPKNDADLRRYEISSQVPLTLLIGRR